MFESYTYTLKEEEKSEIFKVMPGVGYIEMKSFHMPRSGAVGMVLICFWSQCHQILVLYSFLALGFFSDLSSNGRE